MDHIMVVIGIFICIVVFFVLLGVFLFRTDSFNYESAEKKAGRQGEQFASGIIREILNEKDVLLTNIKIVFDGKETELDNVIINNRGVFIIEVKNYTGILIGDEDDCEWIKNKYTSAGNFYQKSLKNPIKQVKRQIYILSGFLKQYGFEVWIEGYVFFVEMNSPVESKYVLKTQKDIHEALHLGTNNKLTQAEKERIIKQLTEMCLNPAIF